MRNDDDFLAFSSEKIRITTLRKLNLINFSLSFSRASDLHLFNYSKIITTDFQHCNYLGCTTKIITNQNQNNKKNK